MKKIMMAVAIVCAAVGVQAASISWTSNLKSLTDIDGNVLRSSSAIENIVLVNLGSTLDWKNATVIPTGTGSGTTTMNITTQTNSKGGRITGTATFTYVDGTTDLINNGDYLALMVEDDEGNLSKLVYTSGDDKGKDVEATWKVSGLASNTSTLSAKAIGMTGNFTAESVPEPTSAMLLVLGLAGLALRRRHV